MWMYTNGIITEQIAWINSATAQFYVDDGNADYTLNYNLTLWLIPCFVITKWVSVYFHASDLVNITYCFIIPIWLLANSLQFFLFVFFQSKIMVTYTMQYWPQHKCCQNHKWRIKIHKTLLVLNLMDLALGKTINFECLTLCRFYLARCFWADHHLVTVTYITNHVFD